MIAYTLPTRIAFQPVSRSSQTALNPAREEDYRQNQRRSTNRESLGKPIPRPEDIKHWSAPSDDWHATTSSVDLREGGCIRYRMELP